MNIDRVSNYERNDAVIAMPNTGMKKNITMRRSQWRPRDRNSIGGTSKPVKNLLSKRHRPREKDVNYASELAPRTASTPTNKLVSDKRNNAGSPEFTRRHLPDEKDDPLIYAALHSRWVEKKGVEEDMKQALQDQNEDSYRFLESRYKALNAQMFSILQSSISRLPVAARPNLPVQMLTERRRNQGAPVTMATGCNYDGTSYVIYLDYQGDVIPWVVWAHMPTSLLVQAAVNVLSGMGIAVSLDEIVLFHNNQPMEPSGGCLSDHPVLVNDIVFIIVNHIQGGIPNRNGTKSSMGHSKCELAITKERGSTNGVTPARSVSGENQRSVNASHERLLHQVDGLHDTNSRNLHASQEVEKDSSVDTSRAHDKIKQSFKCPRFSGQTKDWKLWNKGFLRFLSIWDLDYVVDPNFFEEAPIPDSKIRDNKLVYYILEDATQGSPLAAAYVRQVPLKNGFEAYYTLLDGFVFSGTTTSIDIEIRRIIPRLANASRRCSNDI